jgi:hypothetical protein
MSVQVASGFRDINSTTMKYFPQIFAGKTLMKFYDYTVLSDITNTEYEGSIRNQGDSVIIRAIPDMTIRDYQRGQQLTFDQPTSTATTLNINKAKVWAFFTETIDDKQTDLKDYANRWSDDAGQQLKISIDTDVLGGFYVDAGAGNYGATAGVKSSLFNLGAIAGAAVGLTEANILKYLVQCGIVLDEQNIPEEGRFIVMPPWAVGLLKLSDIKAASLTGDSVSPIRNGKVGKVDRFTVYSSNLLPIVTDTGSKVSTVMPFGHKVATTFAAQLSEYSVDKNPFGFGMLHKGLQVYGYKVVQPKGLGYLFAYWNS